MSELEDQDLAGTCGIDAGAYCSDDNVSDLVLFNVLADVGLGVAVAGLSAGLVFLILELTSDDAPAVSEWLQPDGAVRF
jgi:hypothetical protein